MAQQGEDLSFLAFFLNEPVYLLPEEAPVYISHLDEAPDLPTEEASVAEEPVVESEVVAPDVPIFEGENRKAVLVLFHQPNTEQLESSSKTFLQKILSAVEHGPEDVALCNWALLERKEKEEPGIYETIQRIDSQKILVFGDLPLAWSMSHFFQKYHISEDAEGRQLLQADDLLNIAQKRDLKVKLWESLQRLFK